MDVKDMILNCDLVIKRNNEVVNTSNTTDKKAFMNFTKALSYVVNKKNHDNITKTKVESDQVKKIVKIYVYFKNVYTTHDIAIEGLKLVDVEKQEIITHTYEYTFSGDILDYMYIW